MLKNIFLVSLCLGSSILFLNSCDNIKIEDRYEPVKKPTIEKHMLLLEFTGNRCTNCPKGAAALHNIQEAYPNEVIIVGLHPEGGGPNTRPIGDQDFRCAEAQVMYEFYNPAGFPCAVFNGNPALVSTSYTTWTSTAFEIFTNWEQQGITSGMNLEAQTSYNQATREVTVDYSIEMLKDFQTPMSVMVWIMENDIIGWQLDGDEYVSDYVHNHVLRASLNGNWGEQLPQSLLSEGNTLEGTASIILDEKWNAENCQIVIYTFNTETKETEQVIAIDVTD